MRISDWSSDVCSSDLNASGGLVNFITGHGSKNFEGAVRLETGTGNRIRGDVAVSGPLSDRLSATISGFYRRDDGLRDTGFKNADLGGQIKAGNNYELDRGRIWAEIGRAPCRERVGQ